MMSSQFFCKYANVDVYVYVHIQVWSFIYTHHIRFLKITKINEHHISLHRNPSTSTSICQKIAVPSINPSVQRTSVSETHCVQRKSVFPKFLFGFSHGFKAKKIHLPTPSVAEIFPMFLHLRAVAHQKIHAGLDQRLTTGSSCFHGFRTGFHLAKFQRFETYWGW